jgi:hypothetical protein
MSPSGESGIVISPRIMLSTSYPTFHHDSNSSNSQPFVSVRNEFSRGHRSGIDVAELKAEIATHLRPHKDMFYFLQKQ